MSQWIRLDSRAELASLEAVMPRALLPQPLSVRLRPGARRLPNDAHKPTVVQLGEGDALDVRSAIPYYYQLLKVIESNIQRGVWQPGQKLPSERELCNHFGVSRVVARQALNLLAAAGLIETYRGKGSYVAVPKFALHQMGELISFFDDAADKGKQVVSRILDLKVIPAYGEIAQFLQLAEGDPVILLHRLRFVDGQPVLISLTYLPERLCPGLSMHDFTHQSLYAVLDEHYGLRLSTGSRTIESVNAPPDLAELLQVPDGAALSLLKGVGCLDDGTPLEYYMSWHRGDRSRFQVHLVKAPNSVLEDRPQNSTVEPL